jgi:hypothetical protein
MFGDPGRVNPLPLPSFKVEDPAWFAGFDQKAAPVEGSEIPMVTVSNIIAQHEVGVIKA